MLKIRSTKAAQDCLLYFLGDRGLTPREKEGTWQGRGCEVLGVAGGSRVQARDFALMLDGYDAHGTQFVRRWRNPRRAAYDLVFSCSKPVSIAALCWPERGEEVRECFDESTAHAFGLAERLAQRQVPKSQSAKTGMLTAACFTHEASRFGDPHLHRHMVTGNVTWDRGFWALDADAIFQCSGQIDGFFQRDLAERLRKRGLRSSIKAGVAVLDVPEELCARLSRGRNAIEEVKQRVRRRVGEQRAMKGLSGLIGDRLRTRRKAPAPEKRFENLLSEGEAQALSRLVGPVVQGVGSVHIPTDTELWLFLRRELRRRGLLNERARWETALRAAIQYPMLDANVLLDRALSPYLLGEVGPGVDWDGISVRSELAERQYVAQLYQVNQSLEIGVRNRHGIGV